MVSRGTTVHVFQERRPLDQEKHLEHWFRDRGFGDSQEVPDCACGAHICSITSDGTVRAVWHLRHWGMYDRG
jgi:hypothetical protein